MTTLSLIREFNPNWFSPHNKRFFGDISYRVLHGKKTRASYLVRETNAWTDMFDHVKKPHWRVNFIKDDNSIGKLVDIVFDDLTSVKSWLQSN